MNFDEVLKLYKTKTCILSIEDMGKGRYGNIRVVAGNKAHADDIGQVTGHPFEPGCPYEMCFPKDLNFENFVYRFAVGVSLSCDEPDILKAMRAADKKMYEDKKRYYENNPDFVYRQ